MKVILPYQKNMMLVGARVIGVYCFTDDATKTTEFVMVFDRGEILYQRSSASVRDCFILCRSIEDLKKEVTGEETGKVPIPNVSDGALAWLREKQKDIVMTTAQLRDLYAQAKNC